MEELDLKELFNIFWSRKIQIGIIIAIFLVIGFIYTFVFVKPDYASTTTVILAQSSSATTGTETGSDTITANDLTLNQKLVSTYSELLTSPRILSEVISNLRIDRTEASLKNSITVSAVEDTDLIQIRVTDASPETAKRIAEEVARVFIEQVANGVYKINNVQVWDEAEVPTEPYNINHGKDLVIFLFIGIVIGVVYALIANMLDTTVKSKEDIEKKLGLSVLTTIPICDFDLSMKTVNKGGRK